MARILTKPLRLALIQLSTTLSKSTNLANARLKVLSASSQGANLIVLPECFNSPYGTSFFHDYAESLLPSPPSEAASPSWHALRNMAREAGVWVVGGSIPERDGERVYNTSLTFSPGGELVTKHRKLHLFDIDIPGKITFKESETLSPGDGVTVFEMQGWGKVGVGICYDVRFPEMAMIAARRGAFLMVYPGAFNLTTGPMHWELLARARAVDNQIYVGMCSPARGEEGYIAWGHSLAVGPDAKVIGEAETGEETVYADLTGEKLEETRKGVPIYQQRRFDVYPDVSA
ncbi:MAG: hypothetical protein M1814_000794 [Vezdaea aestivalis]|nr:MAG: hypothetical protein M1814_000794 [Vezdaea aestivalis]